MNVLLLPDRPGWAFDRRARGLVAYNPFPDIGYHVQYVIDRPAVDWRNWDAVVFFVMEAMFGNHPQKLVRQCYSARWVMGDYSKDEAANLINGSRAVIFANHFIRDDLGDRVRVPSTVIADAADPNFFHPAGTAKNPRFTALFAGNPGNSIKRFSAIRECCAEAAVPLAVASGTQMDAMREEYCRVDVCVNFSVQEGGPAVMVEAALCGVPTVIPVGVGLSDQIPCFVVKDRQDLVATLRRLKDNRDECRVKGAEARRVALERFTAQQMAEKYGKLLKELFD